MKRKHKREKIDREVEVKSPQISHETQKSVIAILLFGITAVLMLASFGKAGPAGDFLFSVLSNLFGWGYYLWPLASCIVAISLLISHEQKFMSLTAIGVSGFIISTLGFIDIILPERGGLIGNVIGALEVPFGYTASIILTACLSIASIFMTLNAKIVLKKPEEDPDESYEESTEVTPAKHQMEQKPITVQTPDGKKETMILNEPQAKLASAPVAQIEKVKEKDELSGDDLNISYGLGRNKKPKEPYKPLNYNAPPLALLKTSVDKPTSGDVRANANIIKRTLESFGIHVEMGEINIGPKVTRYTLKPAEGIKLSKIIALNQDLALALAAHPIRIEAPIPGKSLVGIEVPNKTGAIVRLGTMLGFQEFGGTGPLSFVLGRDVTGEPIYGDIERMPHMLIAGATGSGKSVAIHSLLISLLYKNSPETLQLILIDPKRVELSVYSGIPHLVAPVITDGKKSVGVFRWAISEMEKRYETFVNAGVRDIKSYNKSNNPPLPFIVIVVDELADLMAAYGREIETSVVRLAQMARATGIHLVLSTQRPSVEVITGLIKANITSRMALQVASQIDSRTILDSSGAEKLLGGGDMLFVSQDFSKPKRIQGAYVSEEEIHKVADYILENNSSIGTVDTQIEAIQQIKSEGEKAAPGGIGKADEMFDSYLQDEDDELYDEAVTTVVEAKKASASLLQRRLKVGYARAARLLDLMEGKGVISPGDGAKPREVFLDKIGGDIVQSDFPPEK